MKQNKYPAAYQALLQLRGPPILTAKELLYTHVQMEVEEKFLRLAPKDVEFQRGQRWMTPTHWSIYARKLRVIFRTRRTRRAAVAAVVCMIGQQLCGVNVLEFYSSTIYGDASARHSCGEAYRKHPARHLGPLWLTWGVGLANFVFTFPVGAVSSIRRLRYKLIRPTHVGVLAHRPKGQKMATIAHITILGTFHASSGS
jgi:hypothetical protein